MKNLIFSFCFITLFISCTPGGTQESDNIEHLKAEVDNRQTELSERIENFNLFYKDYKEMFHKMKDNELLKHPELKELMMTFKNTGRPVLEGSKNLLKKQTSQIESADESNRKAIYKETAMLYKRQIEKTDSISAIIENIKTSFEETFSEALKEKQ